MIQIIEMQDLKTAKRSMFLLQNLIVSRQKKDHKFN